MGRFIKAAAAAAVLWLGAGAAANAEEAHRFYLVNVGDESARFVDLSSIETLSGGMRRSWSYDFYAEAQTDADSPYWITATYTEYDCRKRQWRTLNIVEKDARAGEVENFDYNDEFDWNTVESGTVGEDELEKSCGLSTPAEDEVTTAGLLDLRAAYMKSLNK